MQIANSADGRKILYDIDPITMTEGAINSAPTAVSDSITQAKGKVNSQLSISNGEASNRKDGYTANDNGVQYSVSATNYMQNVGDFSEQVDNISRIPKNEALVVCGTPDVFTDIGFNWLPMTLNLEHAKDAVQLNPQHPDRYIGKAVLKDLPNALQAPVAIIASNSQSGTSLVAIVELKGKNGKNIIAPVYINGISRTAGIRMDVNAVSSVHERRNAISKLLADAINTEASGNIGVFYVDNKKATQLVRGEGLQLPNSFTSMNGSIHSIYENGSPVKAHFKTIYQTDTKQFKKWFGKSKVVDEDGKPLIVYRGTDTEFFEFDMSKSRTNMDIQGAFFSPYKLDAQGYGKNVGGFYISLQNPADEKTAYMALNRFKGQNNAGIKAREYLIQQGYDGVYNGYDEYIAFYPEQIKSATDNIGTFDKSNPDVRYSFSNSNETFNRKGGYTVFADDMRIRDIAPVAKTLTDKKKTNSLDDKRRSGVRLIPDPALTALISFFLLYFS